jgi:hypothetical protein
VEQYMRDVERLMHGIFLCVLIVVVRSSVCFCGVMLYFYT